MDSKQYDEIVKVLTAEGYVLNANVLEFIQNFGNLELDIPAFRVEGKMDKLHFNLIKACEGIYPEKVKEEYEPRVGEALVVVGQAYSEHLTLMFSQSGKIYGAYDDYLTLLGDSVEEALENMLNKRETKEVPQLHTMFLHMPAGEIICKPTPKDVCELLKMDGAFWEQGSGSASLMTGSEGLMFYYDEGYGYVVLQMDEFKSLMDEEGDKNTFIVHHIGGEPFPVPICFYMNYEQAKKILLHFLATGEKLNYKQWYDIYANFDADSYYESEEYSKCTKVLKGFSFLDKLYHNRLLRNDQEFENFEQALEHLSHIEDCSIIPQICSCFDDDTKDEEVMFGLIHLVEAFDDECGLIALVNALPSMLTKASNWAKILLIRILNDERSSHTFKHIIIKNKNKITIEKLLEGIGH